MADSVLSAPEETFLRALGDLGVRFILVGMSAALLQGARGATDDFDLWFEDVADPRIGDAARRAGGFYVSANFGMRPPALGGDALGDRFDVVTHMHGLGTFADEWANTRAMSIDGVLLHVLLLPRIVTSKRAAGRPKDLAQVPALEEAIAAIESGELP